MIKRPNWISAIILACVLLAGCVGGLQQKKSAESSDVAQKLGAHNAQNIEHLVSGTKAPQTPTVTQSGSSNTLAITMRPATEPYSEQTRLGSTTGIETVGRRESVSSSVISLPAGVRMALWAFGLACVVGVVGGALWFARRSSVAARAVIDAADAGIANSVESAHDGFAAAVRILRDRATHATNDKEIASFGSAIGELESQRGKVSGKLEQERTKLRTPDAL